MLATTTGSVEIMSKLAATPEQVWDRISSPEGINHELMPIMRMTVPRGAGSLDLNTVPVGKRLGRSWILLGGLVPVDYDDICIVELEPGRRFLERSTMLAMRSWQHERTVDPDGDGCVVTDTLTFTPRLPLPARWVEPIVRAIFRHRHRRLAAWSGS